MLCCLFGAQPPVVEASEEGGHVAVPVKAIVTVIVIVIVIVIVMCIYIYIQIERERCIRT